MEIPGISTSSLFGSSFSKQTQGLKQAFRSAPAGDTAPAEPVRKRGKAFGEANGFALGALRQEIRAALSERFRVAFSSAVGTYNKAAPTASDVAGDALAAAGQVAKADPLDASAALKQLRNDVSAAGDALRDIIDDDDLDDVEDAIARISSGLDDADDDAARNTLSAASFLSAESVLKQRSTIRIKTQEGDVVTLDLRRREAFSAEDVALQNGQGSFTSTEVSVSSRSRLVFSVKGDINEQELAAIQGVFEQAEAIADDFFGGDLARAFDAASGLSYDAEQLSRVSLKFRERETTRVNFAQLGNVAVPAFENPVKQPTTSDPADSLAALPPGKVVPDTETTIPAAAPVDAVAAAEESKPVDVAAQLVEASAAATEIEEPVAKPAEAAADTFADQLKDFLRSTLDGFSNGGEQRFFYSESFKLNLLKTVISVSAPVGGEQAAETAGNLIDAASAEDRDD